jgi:hypothetical protein
MCGHGSISPREKGESRSDGLEPALYPGDSLAKRTVAALMTTR